MNILRRLSAIAGSILIIIGLLVVAIDLLLPDLMFAIPSVALWSAPAGLLLLMVSGFGLRRDY